jgi:drug/metabolite transporter, DME family
MKEESVGTTAGLGLTAVAGAAALWAIAAIVARDLFDAGVEPLELAGARAVIAAAGFTLLGVFVARDEPSGRTRNHAAGLVILGIAIALVNGTYYLAIDRLSVAVAVVLQYTAPVLVVTWAAVRYRRAPSGEVLAALVAALFGVFLVVELPAGEVGGLSGIGILFGLASAVLFATYSVLSDGLGAVFGAIGAMRRAFLVAALFWVIYLVPFGWPRELFSNGNPLRVAFVGIAGTFLPFLLYVWGIRRVRAERATIAATLEPVLAALFAWVLLDQRLTAMQLVGGVLVIAGVAMLQARRARPVRAPEP